MSEWIKCSDKLPPIGETVLCYKGSVFTAWYIEKSCPYEKKRKGWHIDWAKGSYQFFKDFDVTHWMPLPDKPNDGE